MPSLNKERLLSTTQVANRLNVHRDTVLVWAREGTLPALRLRGGHFRFRVVDVMAMLSPVAIESGD